MQTWADIKSRKMLARAVFSTMMSALVFLLQACIPCTMVRLLLFVHAMKSGTSGTLGGKGAYVSGDASDARKGYT